MCDVSVRISHRVVIELQSLQMKGMPRILQDQSTDVHHHASNLVWWGQTKHFIVKQT